MEQTTFAELEYDLKKRRTRREKFLEKMDGLIPWERLEARIEPFHPKAGRSRRWAARLRSRVVAWVAGEGADALRPPRSRARRLRRRPS